MLSQTSRLVAEQTHPKATAKASAKATVAAIDGDVVLKPSISQEQREPAITESQIYDTYGNEFLLPDYTISQVRAAIPDHCYCRSSLRSLAYVTRDFLSYIITMVLFEMLVSTSWVPWFGARLLLSAIYVTLQSLHMTGLWVLGHECGHQAFSASRTLNDIVGFVLHSLLLVPYFSWKISHGKHHKATNNITRDMGFMPPTKAMAISARVGVSVSSGGVAELVEDTPWYSAYSLVKLQLFGWWVYLLTNLTSHNQHEGQKQGRGVGKRDGLWTGVNHFNTRSPIFDNEHVSSIIASNIGLLTTISLIALLARGYGWHMVALHYILPYLLLNNWIILITSMQHSDPSVPHYLPASWNWTRGSAATIDRDFGFVGRYFFHSIIETHVLHHHVSTIPFYHAREASHAIQRVLGTHYRSDTRGGMVGYLKAVWVRARYCRWVEATSVRKEHQGILFYKFPRKMESR